MSTELHLAEIGALRAEVNSAIDRMNGNENFSAGTVSAVFAFILTTAITPISVVLSLLCLVVVGIGVRRYKELRSHAHKIDDYLKEIETEISADGGWTTHYYKSMEGNTEGGYSDTRIGFWTALGLVSLGGAIYIIGESLGRW